MKTRTNPSRETEKPHGQIGGYEKRAITDGPHRTPPYLQIAETHDLG